MPMDNTRSIPLHIVRTAPVPLYFQLKEIILNKIKNSDWKSGEAIPTEKELELEYGVSRITVRRALADLAAEGYLYSQSGRGTFVLSPKMQTTIDGMGAFFDDLTRQGYKIESKVLSVGHYPVSRKIADMLQIQEGTPLFTFRRLVYADGEPITLSAVYINLPNVTLTIEELESLLSIYPLIESKYGIFLHRAHKTIEVTVTLPEEAELLHTSLKAPSLLVEWLVQDEQERPVIFMKALYRGDRYKHYSIVTR